MGPVLEAVDAIRFTDKALEPIWEKVQAGRRLTAEDGLALFRSDDFISLGRMGDFVARKKSGDRVQFVINRHVNPTNVCVLRCKFCDFRADKGDPNAYEMSMEQILGMLNDEIKEVHIVGGHHPDWPFERFEDMLRTIHERFPEMQIKAFTAAEIDYFHKRWKVPPEEALARLKAVGLKSMPGGGAEVFSSRVAKLLNYTGKANSKRWLEIHKLAHRMGIPSNGTMLYGHIETYEERVHHLLLLREAQDETGGFLTFIPLAFHPKNTGLSDLAKTSGIDDLKNIAVARCFLDNFPHIKAYWVMIGPKLAQVALAFGADDVDGTVKEELITQMAGGESEQAMAREQLLRMIRQAGREPVERDTLYNVIKAY